MWEKISQNWLYAIAPDVDGAGSAKPGQLVVFGAYATPIEEPWDGVIHAALNKAQADGKIKYTYAVRRVAKDYPEIAFVFGSGGGPAEPNFSVFDNWIHEPAYLSGMLAGGLTKSNVIGLSMPLLLAPSRSMTRLRSK